jgi:hypothetical protein
MAYFSDRTTTYESGTGYKVFGGNVVVHGHMYEIETDYSYLYNIIAPKVEAYLKTIFFCTQKGVKMHRFFCRIFLSIKSYHPTHTLAGFDLTTHNSTSRVFTTMYVYYATRDRCYDFRNIFAEKNCEKIGVFDS